MQLDGINIALRERSPWEATDLGIALTRACAGRLYAAWVLLTLPICLAVNGVCFLSGHMLPAVFVLWWLKPAFDRIPLFVMSRAVFGAMPSLRETLRAQFDWGWRGLLPWLTWRRLHPGRAMLLPVDLLEGLDRQRRRERVRVLGASNASPNVLLTLIGINLEAVLAISVWLLALMFIPVEFFSDSLKAVWDTLIDKPPLWAQGLTNLVGWLSMSVVEPFYVGAGFGLYLNRRVQLEGWDIELAFRRIAARLAQPLAAMLLLTAAVFTLCADQARAAEPATSSESVDEVGPDQGAAAQKPDKIDSRSLQQMFGKNYRADAQFTAVVKKVYADGDLSPKEEISMWQRRHPSPIDVGKAGELPAWAKQIGQLLGFLFRYALWIAVAILLIIALLNVRRWMPWLADRLERAETRELVGIRDITTAERLPDDIPAAVRALLQRGRAREALALLYRASVERLATALGKSLPPGATEAECLLQSRRLQGSAYAALFARIVRCWQSAAYAQRLPAAAEIEALLVAWDVPPATTMAGPSA